MPFPSNSKKSLKTLWDQIKDTSGRIKNTTTAIAAASSINRRLALDFANMLADCLDSLDANTANATANGLLAYAREQENDPTLDLPGLYSTMRTQIVATQSWLTTNFPHTGSELLVYTFDGNSRFSDIILTPGQLSSFKTQVAALDATIA